MREDRELANIRGAMNAEVRQIVFSRVEGSPKFEASHYSDLEGFTIDGGTTANNLLRVKGGQWWNHVP